jgi:hypothetical protein
VGGVHFSGGVATFETTGFSYYVVTNSTCSSPNAPTACSASCQCCGTTSCVDTASDPHFCGACNVACAASQFCSGASQCVNLAQTRLCENKSLYVVNGELPTLSVVTPDQTTDSTSASEIAKAIGTACAVTPTTVPQAQAGILDPCTDQPLLKGGTTILLVGGTFAQRLARAIERSSLTPVYVEHSDAAKSYTYKTRAGTALVTFPESNLSPAHDYFVISLVPDPERGALILYIYGLGSAGTPAAKWLFINQLLPQITAGTRTWQRYQLYEWQDNGDKVPGSADTYTLIAQDQ